MCWHLLLTVSCSLYHALVRDFVFHILAKFSLLLVINPCYVTLQNLFLISLSPGRIHWLILVLCDVLLLLVLWSPFWLWATLYTAEWTLPGLFALSSHLLVLYETLLYRYSQRFHGQFFQKWVARSFFPICLSQKAPLKPVHHGWHCWYLKSWWHSFQHHSNTQLPQYDNWEMRGVVPWLGNEPGLWQWEHGIVTTRSPDCDLTFTLLVCITYLNHYLLWKVRFNFNNFDEIFFNQSH